MNIFKGIFVSWNTPFLNVINTASHITPVQSVKKKTPRPQLSAIFFEGRFLPFSALLLVT